MLSTWDIIEEHFGFMLVWGDMVYVVFLYPIAGWFTAEGTSTNNFNIFILIFIHIIGHSMFR